MDTLAKLISSLEVAIRYLLTGSVVSLVVVLSRSDYGGLLAWGASNIPLAAVVVAITGFSVFSFYRMIYWTVGDAIAWRLGLSVPALFKTEGWGYDKPFAQFLVWRHSGQLNQSLSGYLTYRWAVAHFASVSGIALALASFLSQESSWVASHDWLTRAVGTAALTLGVWQSAFLHRVERDLCEQTRRA